VAAPGLEACAPELSAPADAPATPEATMRVLVHPLHNRLKLFEAHEPWVDALQQALAR
jgi:hypothetical protein